MEERHACASSPCHKAPQPDGSSRHALDCPIFPCSFPLPGVRHVDVGDLQAQAGGDALQEAGGAAVQVVACDDVLPRARQPHHRAQRRHAARKGKRPVAALLQSHYLNLQQVSPQWS